ncbi:MAG TPA: lipoyl(octanoyl) transferase LipB [Gemmatimonadaceae bacterium]|nr:lipoyl(octanoyl) transferase LipB [Gemmatimonadaceae bacterium]
MTRPQLWIADLGTCPYGQVLEFQRAVARARITGEVPEDVLLLVEHPPVVTLGRSSKDAHLLASPELLAARGVELFEVERGGDVTFHGPGQLVGYPILNLERHRKDLHWYLRQVEESLIVGLREFSLQGTRSAGQTGVWVGGPAPAARPATAPAGFADQAGRAAPIRKIASIGVHARSWVTWHGFALNVSTDLGYFDLMVPCGIQGVTMTSIERETGRQVAMRAVQEAIVSGFAEVFGLEPVSVAPDALPEAEQVG